MASGPTSSAKAQRRFTGTTTIGPRCSIGLRWLGSCSIGRRRGQRCPELTSTPLCSRQLVRERNGDFVRKRMDQCSGAEILEETLRHLRFDRHLATIMASSICVPCNLPYVNNIWLPRSRGDRPPSVPERSTNLGLIGQYVEVPREIAFTIECSVRSAWEAIYILLKRGPAPPPVYQSQYDPKALFDALKVFVCQ